MNIEVKRSCQIKPFDNLLTCNSKKKLVINQNLNKKSSSLYWYKCRPLYQFWNYEHFVLNNEIEIFNNFFSNKMFVIPNMLSLTKHGHDELCSKVYFWNLNFFVLFLNAECHKRFTTICNDTAYHYFNLNGYCCESSRYIILMEGYKHTY